MIRRLFVLVALGAVLFPLSTLAAPGAPAKTAVPAEAAAVPIFLYHRFGPTVADSMTVRTPVFEAHLQHLLENGYRVIPLRQVVDWRLGKGQAPPPKSVVIMADDGHKSVYTEMAPLVRKYKIPVTLFIYPSAISNAKYAMTWDQLRELKGTGLFDVQSHTYWHPNFNKERKKLSPAEFDKFTTMQLSKSKEKLEKQVGGTVDLLAWPFGIYDDDLVARAAAAGYRATFTIERRHVGGADKAMELPRYLLIDADQGKVFARILAGSAPKRNLAF